MKVKLAITVSFVFAITLLASVVLPPYDNSKPPRMTLPAAYERAVIALGAATNQFHCISASITTEFPEDGWYFTFCSTNSKIMPKLVVVEFTGKVIFDNRLR